MRKARSRQSIDGYLAEQSTQGLNQSIGDFVTTTKEELVYAATFVGSVFTVSGFLINGLRLTVLGIGTNLFSFGVDPTEEAAAGLVLSVAIPGLGRFSPTAAHAIGGYTGLIQLGDFAKTNVEK